MASDLNSIPIDFDKIERGNKFLAVATSDPVHLSLEELSAFSGTEDGKPIYVALLGNIYDVTSGKNFYGPGGAYEVFAGKDATRGLASFNMSSKRRKADNDKDHKEDYSDLSEKHMESAKRWQKLFESKYPLVGYMKVPTLPVESPLQTTTSKTGRAETPTTAHQHPKREANLAPVVTSAPNHNKVDPNVQTCAVENNKKSALCNLF